MQAGAVEVWCFFFYGLGVIRTDFPAIVGLLRHAQEGHGEGWSCLGGSWVYPGKEHILTKIVFMFPSWDM